MQSPVNWGLLGLVIERPSYAYELAQRFERKYAGALSLSSLSHAYTALGSLKEKGLVREIPGTREGRQPKPGYRATELGERSYRQWLVGEAREDARRRQLFVTQVAALAKDPQAALRTIELYEQACLEEAGRAPVGQPPGGRPHAADEAPTGDRSATDSLVDRLLAEERRVAGEAKLRWIAFARTELEALRPRAAAKSP